MLVYWLRNRVIMFRIQAGTRESSLPKSPQSLLFIYSWVKGQKREADTLATYDKGKGKGKGKAIPLQAWTGPEGSRRLRLPDLKKIGS